MKRCLTIFLVTVMLFSLVACGKTESANIPGPTSAPAPTSTSVPTENARPTEKPGNTEQPVKYSYDANDMKSMLTFIKTTGAFASADIATQAETLVDRLGNTYSTYSAHKADITAFFDATQARSTELYKAFYACCIDYYRCVAKQGLQDYSAWDDALGELYDQWDESLEEYYDTWDKSFENVYETCDELISDASDELEYSEYSDAWSEMYDEYSNAWSEMYEEYSDIWSALYEDYSSIWSSFYDGESDVDDILSIQPTEDKVGGNTEDDSISSTSSCGEIEDQIETEIETAVSELTVEWEALSRGIDNYKDYKEQAAKIQAFYDKMNRTSERLCLRMCEYSIAYAEAILASGKSARDMYADMSDLYDAIYSEACDNIYDGIYSGLLDDMYDAFYSGALNKFPEGTDYEDWYETRSQEYDLWSDARSDTYDHWSDARSDIYDFWGDMRSELWDGDIEGAKEDIEKFREDIQ